MTAQAIPDFTLRNEGTITLLTPKSEEALAFVESHIDPEAQMFCDAYVIEPRYLPPIVEHARSHGLTVEEE